MLSLTTASNDAMFGPETPGKLPTTTPTNADYSLIESFPNPNPENDYVIRIRVPEFTCLCPKTGQPDFASLLIEYVPAERCIELKSLKLYVWAYRTVGAFHEAVTNRILADLSAVLEPRFVRVTAEFNVRGGIYTTVTAQHRAADWRPEPSVDLDRATPEIR